MVNDLRFERMAKILVDYSARIGPGDRVAIEANMAAEPLVRALYALILERGGHPHLLLALNDQDEIFFQYANDAQLDYIPVFRMHAYEAFESRFNIHSSTNPRALSNIDPARQSRRSKALAPITATQMRRGAQGAFRWVTTLYPTEAYAHEAGMSLEEYQDFVFRACHADENTLDPVAYWQNVKHEQLAIIERLAGRDLVKLHGPNVDLSLSIKGRQFVNASGENNMPDGEIFTGPVEDSANGWVRFTYPAVFQGRLVEGIELVFEQGWVVKASSQTHQDFLLRMIDTDPGARYIGEFAIGTNFEIDRVTRNILFDEKIGGSFHMALGAGYPETGSVNKSAIHWDIICDMKQDSEILMDGELVYQNGRFIV